jgi:hypothetical protein
MGVKAQRTATRATILLVAFLVVLATAFSGVTKALAAAIEVRRHVGAVTPGADAHPSFVVRQTPHLRSSLLRFQSPAEATVPRGRGTNARCPGTVPAALECCWQNRDYRTIIVVAERLPENVLQEDPKLLMWFDQAQTRTGGQ